MTEQLNPHDDNGPDRFDSVVVEVTSDRSTPNQLRLTKRRASQSQSQSKPPAVGVGASGPYDPTDLAILLRRHDDSYRLDFPNQVPGAAPWVAYRSPRLVHFKRSGVAVVRAESTDGFDSRTNRAHV